MDYLEISDGSKEILEVIYDMDVDNATKVAIFRAAAHTIETSIVGEIQVQYMYNMLKPE